MDTRDFTEGPCVRLCNREGVFNPLDLCFLTHASMDLDFTDGDLSSVNPLNVSLALYVVQIINAILQVWIENIGDCYVLCLMQNIQEPQNNFPGNIKI